MKIPKQFLKLLGDFIFLKTQQTNLSATAAISGRYKRIGVIFL